MFMGTQVSPITYLEYSEDEDKATVDDVSRRLRRIEGQVQGIQRMLEKDKCSGDILVQVAAARAAMNKVGSLLLERHLRVCLSGGSTEGIPRDISDFMDVYHRFVK